MFKRILGSVAVLGAAASIAGLATFATFTSSTSASHGLSSGTVSITLGAAGPANRLAVGASGLVPGDTLQRAVDLINNGSASSDDLSAITLTTSASPSSLLDSDAANGLQVQIDKCSVPWNELGPPYTYGCSGTTTSILASRPVIGSNIALSSLSSLVTGATDHLLVILTLPPGAPNSLQGLNSTITYDFTGTQRAAASK